MTAQRRNASTSGVPIPRPDPAGASRQTSTARSQSGYSEQAPWATYVLLALDDLERVDRRALQLTYWRGLTQAQVATELELPERAVRTHIARGMRELAARLVGGGGVTSGAADGHV